MKCCTKLETAKERCPIVFQGHPSNFKVTLDKTSPILTQIGRFQTIGRSQLSNPSDLPCCSTFDGNNPIKSTCCTFHGCSMVWHVLQSCSLIWSFCQVKATYNFTSYVLWAHQILWCSTNTRMFCQILPLGNIVLVMSKLWWPTTHKIIQGHTWLPVYEMQVSTMWISNHIPQNIAGCMY